MVLAYWHNHLLEIMLLCDTYLSGRAHWWYDVANSMSTMIAMPPWNEQLLRERKYL